MCAFEIFISYAGHCNASSFLQFKNADKQFKQNFRSPFNALRRKGIKKTLIPSRVFDINI